MDIGKLLVVADGVKELFAGDINWDGREDIMVLTTSDKLRAYTNKQGVFDVQGDIVCLDIPLGHKNVSQVRQIFVEDMNGDNQLDIITNDITWDIKIFYGGSSAWWGNYLSTDEFACDENWKDRQQMQLIKSFPTQLWWAIPGEGLRHRPGLEVSKQIHWLNNLMLVMHLLQHVLDQACHDFSKKISIVRSWVKWLQAIWASLPVSM